VSAYRQLYHDFMSLSCQGANGAINARVLFRSAHDIHYLAFCKPSDINQRWQLEKIIRRARLLLLEN
jgi:hypothetical protein